MNNQISISVLHHLAQLVAADGSIKMLPGNEWYGSVEFQTVLYPIDTLRTLDPDDAAGKLWRSATHLKASISTSDDYEDVLDRLIAIDNLLGKTILHPYWVMQLLAVCERERVEALARSRNAGLQDGALPIRGERFRDYERDADLRTIATSIATGPKNGAAWWMGMATAVGGLLTGQPLPHAYALSPRLQQTLLETRNAASYDDLKVSLLRILPGLVAVWLEQLRATTPRSRGTKHNPAADARHSQADHNPATDVRDHDHTAPASPRHEAPPEDIDSHTADAADADTDTDEAGDPATNDPADDVRPIRDGPSPDPCAGASDDAPTDESQARTDDAPEAAIDPSMLDALPDTLLDALAEAAATQRLPAIINFAANAVVTKETADRHEQSLADRSNERNSDSSRTPAASPPPSSLARDDTFDEPPTQQDLAGAGRGGTQQERVTEHSWDAILAASANIRVPIRRAFATIRAEEEDESLQHGQNQGFIRTRIAALPEAFMPDNPFSARVLPTDISIAATLAVDCSGSMFAESAHGNYAAAFGRNVINRTEVAQRLVATASTELQRYGSAVGVYRFGDRSRCVASLKTRFSAHERSNIIQSLAPNHEGTLVEDCLTMMLDDLRKAKHRKRLAIVLTDGAFADTQAALETVVKQYRFHHIALIVLTLNFPATTAKALVGDDFADEISDDTIGLVLSHHIARQLRGR